MKAPFELVYLLATGAWVGALIFVSLALPLVKKRVGERSGWQVSRTLLPLVDLFGTWAGTLAVIALWLARRAASPPPGTSAWGSWP